MTTDRTPSLEPLEKEEVPRKEPESSQVDLLVWTLHQTSPILNRLYDSSFELTPLTDHLEEFKLLIMEALELAPQPNHRE
ncbi:MAG: hypothetical protein ACE5OZ_19125 [Candidatus Heimdallarchaeota archaeon]